MLELIVVCAFFIILAFVIIICAAICYVIGNLVCYPTQTIRDFDEWRMDRYRLKVSLQKNPEKYIPKLNNLATKIETIKRVDPFGPYKYTDVYKYDPDEDKIIRIYV